MFTNFINYQLDNKEVKGGSLSLYLRVGARGPFFIARSPHHYHCTSSSLLLTFYLTPLPPGCLTSPWTDIDPVQVSLVHLCSGYLPRHGQPKGLFPYRIPDQDGPERKVGEFKSECIEMGHFLPLSN